MFTFTAQYIPEFRYMPGNIRATPVYKPMGGGPFRDREEFWEWFYRTPEELRPLADTVRFREVD